MSICLKIFMNNLFIFGDHVPSDSSYVLPTYFYTSQTERAQILNKYSPQQLSSHSYF